ncbi:MAG TPA: polysaccharide deacetylase family protein [Acidimicrobiales bacterium]|nr:polysaccharide deacetylase family protein [Acidimicrobiales bacterium]
MTRARSASEWTRRSVLATAAAALLSACGLGAAKRAAGPKRPPVTTTTVVPTTTTTAAPTGPATYVANGSRSGKGVALTFHGSGDVALTQQLLTEARQQSAPITIFGVGTWLEANPTMAHQILAAGHTLGNHTYDHPDLGSLDAGAVADEIQHCATILDQLEGDNGHWFRPSGIVVPTSFILEQAGLAGYPVSVGYDIDPLDYQDPGPSVIVQRVSAALRPGSIVSLHTGHAGTVQAFGALVELIRSRGLTPVLIGDLIKA